jgi:hypothetical protein
MDVWERLAAVIHRLGDFDDIVVGKALEEMDAILESEKLSWFDVGERLRRPPAEPAAVVSGFRAAPKDGAPPVMRRQPSQWLTDKHDVTQAFAVREEADPWTREFIESVHDSVVNKGFKLSEKQRTVLDEKMDKLGI